MYDSTLIYSELISNYGISHSMALKLCRIMHVSPLRPLEYFNNKKLDKGNAFLNSKDYFIGYKLKDNILDNLLYYSQIKNIKSFKYSKFLPIRGQRTKSNAKTAKKQAQIYSKLLIERNKITKVVKVTEKKKKIIKKK
jgi:small subunit ribosomal protein S13